MPDMNIFEPLMAQLQKPPTPPPAVARQFWGTVTSTEPLKVVEDGQTDELEGTPDSLVPVLMPGERVQLMRTGTSLTVVEAAGRPQILEGTTAQREALEQSGVEIPPATGFYDKDEGLQYAWDPGTGVFEVRDAGLAYDTAVSAQISADGKTTTYRSTDVPVMVVGAIGDRWERYDKTSTPWKLIGAWSRESSGWVAVALDAAYLPLVDIGSGTFGQLGGARLAADAIDGKTISGVTVRGGEVIGGTLELESEQPGSPRATAQTDIIGPWTAGPSYSSIAAGVRPNPGGLAGIILTYTGPTGSLATYKATAMTPLSGYVVRQAGYSLTVVLDVFVGATQLNLTVEGIDDFGDAISSTTLQVPRVPPHGFDDWNEVQVVIPGENTDIIKFLAKLRFTLSKTTGATNITNGAQLAFRNIRVYDTEDLVDSMVRIYRNEGAAEVEVSSPLKSVTLTNYGFVTRELDPVTNVETMGTGGYTPAGAVMAFAGSAAPPGYLICDGSQVEVWRYPRLYSAIGLTYSPGLLPVGQFCIPDLRQRVPVGLNAGTFNVLGKTGGAETHTLTVAQMPSHNHGGDTGQTTISGNQYATTGSSNGPARGGGSGTAGVSFSGTGHTHSIPSQGGGGAHNNLQPYIVLNYIIKT